LRIAFPLRLLQYFPAGRSHTVVRRGVLFGGRQCHGGHRRRATAIRFGCGIVGPE